MAKPFDEWLADFRARMPKQEPDESVDVLALFDADDEIAVIDAAIEENSRWAAQASSEAERRGYRENIDRLERAREAALTKAGAA